MEHSTCSHRARERIKSDVRRRLARHANFGCSICGGIPIVFHHIEEWSKQFSNDEKYLIPICDKCHRHIHGVGGCFYSRAELYEFKDTPERPPILRYDLPLGRKRHYSFFVGSNFITNGEKAALAFEFSKGHPLVSIDTSSGILKLSILASLRNDKATYLIRDNELTIDSQDIWNMQYSGASLQIWRRIPDREKATIFIDLAIQPDVIIIRRMNSRFNDKTFRIGKWRKPHQRQVGKIAEQVRQCESLYRERSAQIDGVDIDTLIKQTQKDTLRMRIEQWLSHEFCREFNWDWPYYCWVLRSVLEKSPVFARNKDLQANLSEEHRRINETVAGIRARYQEEFDELKDVFVEYDGNIWLNNFWLS